MELSFLSRLSCACIFCSAPVIKTSSFWVSEDSKVNGSSWNKKRPHLSKFEGPGFESLSQQ